jgi:hypothetical protein
MVVVCGDLNTNYHSENDKGKQIDDILISYNLSSGVDFPTRIQNKSSTTTDNVFVNTLPSYSPG